MDRPEPHERPHKAPGKMSEPEGRTKSDDRSAPLRLTRHTCGKRALLLP